MAGAALFVVLGIVAFVTSFGAHVVAVNLPAHAATVGAGTAMIGALIAAYDAAGAAGRWQSARSPSSSG